VGGEENAYKIVSRKSQENRLLMKTYNNIKMDGMDSNRSAQSSVVGFCECDNECKISCSHTGPDSDNDQVFWDMTLCQLANWYIVADILAEVAASIFWV
jgi:hypothetical protein